VTDATGKEMSAAEIWSVFNTEYLQAQSPFAYVSHHLFEDAARPDVQSIRARLQVNGEECEVHGSGNGPLDAFLCALNVPVNIQSYEERAIGQGSDAQAIAFVEVGGGTMVGSCYGVGMHANIVTASLLAVLSAVNRAIQRAGLQMPSQIGVRRVA